MLTIKSKYNFHLLSNWIKQIIVSVIICLSISDGAIAQAISNVAIISDLEEQKNGFDFTAVNLERTTNYNYITFEVPSRNFYWDNELILPYDSDPDASRTADISILQFDDENKFSKKLIIRCKRNLSPFGNIARYNESGILTKEDKLYVYGSMELSDSIMINGVTQKRFNGNGSFVYRFNEDLELEDEYYFSIDSTINNHFAGFEVGENGDYHLAGFFMKQDDNGDGMYSLQVSGDSIPSTTVELDTTNFHIDNSTYYYVVLDGESKEVKRNIPIQGSGVVAPYLSDVALDEEENFFITAEDRGGLSIYGHTAPNDRGYPLGTVSMSLDKRDSVNFISLYEGLGSQYLTNIELIDDEFVLEVGSSEYGDTLFIDNDFVTKNNQEVSFLTKRDKDGVVDWVKLLSCESGIGILGIDVEESKNVWIGGSAGGDYCLDQLSEFEDLGFRNGYLAKLNHEDGNILNLYQVKMNVDSFEYGTPIVNLMSLQNDKVKIICLVGTNNVNSETYELSIGAGTIEVPAKGELVIFDFDPLVSNTDESNIEDNMTTIYPNPLTQGETPTIKNVGLGSDIDILDLYGTLITKYTYGMDLPTLKSGIYFLNVGVNGTKRTIKLVII